MTRMGLLGQSAARAAPAPLSEAATAAVTAHLMVRLRRPGVRPTPHIRNPSRATLRRLENILLTAFPHFLLCVTFFLSLDAYFFQTLRLRHLSTCLRLNFLLSLALVDKIGFDSRIPTGRARRRTGAPRPLSAAPAPNGPDIDIEQVEYPAKRV